MRGEDREEDYEVLVMQAEDGICRLGADFSIRFANPRMLSMLGFETEDEIVGKSFSDIVRASDRGRAERRFARRKEGLADSYLLNLTRKDGASFPASFSSAPLFRGDAFSGSFATVKDMTRLELVLERLRASEARFRDLASLAPAAICELAPDSSIRYLNDFARRLLGLEGGGRRPPLRAFIPEDELPRFDRTLGEIVAGRAPEPFSLDLAPSGGGRLPALWSAAPIGGRGREPGARVVIVDIKDLISPAFARDEGLFSPYGLTERERSVARRLIAGSIYKEIAFDLGISLSTVRTHAMSLYRRMGIHSKDELFDLALRWQVGRYGENTLMKALSRAAPFSPSAE
jgi:PAS domain S-box-containing protein